MLRGLCWGGEAGGVLLVLCVLRWAVGAWGRAALVWRCAPSNGAAPGLRRHSAGALLGGYESSRFKSKKSPTASKLAKLEVPEGVGREQTSVG